MTRRVLRYAAAAAAGAAVLLALPAAAGAHVVAEGRTLDGTTTVTFSFHHGCETNPTTSLRVQLPDGATDVVAEDPPGWTSTISGSELSWTGGEVPTAEEASFVATMNLTDPEGTMVFLPTVQGCTNGTEGAWIDKTEDPTTSQAAPRIIAGAPATPTTTATHNTTTTAATHNTTTTATHPSTTTAPAAGDGSIDAAAAGTTQESSSSTPLIIGIIAAVVIIGAVIAFVVSRRGSSSPS